MAHRTGPHTKLALLRYLATKGEGRFNQTGRDLGIAASSLSAAFRALQRDGLVDRLIVSGTRLVNSKYILTQSGKDAVHELLEHRRGAV
jgi:DNA-binding HxlR family transcriptional regulator